MFGTYERLGVHVLDSDRTVIREARKKLSRKVVRNPKYRADRKLFYRAILVHHADARSLYYFVQNGG